MKEFNPDDFNDNIKCLTSYCENKPYYFCKTCKDFICYFCLLFLLLLLKGLLSFLPILKSKKRHLTILHDVSGVVKPGR